MNRLAGRDEREIVVDNAADRMAYLVLSYGLLALVAYRSFMRGEASWDLLGLVLLAGLVGTAYRAWQHALSGRWIVVVGMTAGIACLLAAAIVIARLD